MQLLLNAKLERAENIWNSKSDEQKYIILDDIGLGVSNYDFLKIEFRQTLSEGTQIQRHAISDFDGRHPSTEEFWNANKELQTSWLKKI